MPKLTNGASAEDIGLLSALGEMFDEIDPVPQEVVRAGYAAFTWRTIDSELAELAEDSMLAGAGGWVRGTNTKLLAFEAHNVSMVLEVT